MLRKLLPWIAGAVFAVAAFMVVRALREHGLAAVGDAVAAIPREHLLAAALLTTASYLTLGLVDFSALRANGTRQPWHRAALGSFVALSVGHTAGLAVLSSGTLRYRVYSAYGLSEGDVARVIVYCAATVACGLVSLGSVGGLARPEKTAAFLGLDVAVVLALAVAGVALVAAYLVAGACIRRPLRIRSFRVPLPSWRDGLTQVTLGTVNFALVAGVLFQLLGDGVEVGFLAFASFYAAANAASILSHVPGGLGVIEALVLAVAGGPETLGALVAFRVIYYFVPFLLGLLAYAVWSKRRAGREREGSGVNPPATRRRSSRESTT